MPKPSWTVFWLLFLLYMFDYMDRMVIVSLFPFLQEDMGMTDAQCGLLVSAVYWSILAFSFPVSILVDRWSRTRSISIMAALWSLATLACAFTRTFPQLFAARTAIGVGEAGYAPGGTAMLSARFPREQRARILGLWNASIPLGSALGIGIGGMVAHHLGWRHAFGLVALPGMILAVWFYFVEDYKTIRLTRKEPSGREVRMRFREIARQFTHNRTLLCNNLAFALNVFVTTALLTWLPTYFHRFGHLDMDKAGVKAGSVMLLAIVGAPLGGFLADAWMKRRKEGRLLFPAASSVLTGLLLLVAFSFLHGKAQYLVLLLVGVTAVGFVPSGVAVTQDVVHPGLRAVSLSVSIVIQHLLGSSLAPVVVGKLSDLHGLETAMAALPLFAGAAGLLLFIGSFSYTGDLFQEDPEPFEGP
jgi:MFS family permease